MGEYANRKFTNILLWGIGIIVYDHEYLLIDCRLRAYSFLVTKRFIIKSTLEYKIRVQH